MIRSDDVHRGSEDAAFARGSPLDECSGSRSSWAVRASVTTDTGGWPGPLVVGHEVAGAVAAVGKQVRHVQPGQRVTIDPIVPCWTCHQCRRGRPALCLERSELGFHTHGGMAEYVVAPGINIHPLPPTMPWTAGALVEPLACAIRGQDRAGVKSGDSVAIIGGGLQGLLHGTLARLNGATQVLVSARHARRRELAKVICADLVLDPDQEEPVERVLEATDGCGADVVVEASGSASGLHSALRVVGRGGRLLIYGASPPKRLVGVSPFEVFEREISIVGSCGGTGDAWPRAIALLATGAVDATRLVHAEWELHDAPLALNELRTNRDIMKGLVQVHGNSSGVDEG